MRTIPGGINISFERNRGEGGILEAWCYTRASGAASIQAESRPIPGTLALKRKVLESWCYTRRNGAASIQAESRPIPGNSRWRYAWPSSREGGDVLFYTTGQQAVVVWCEGLRLYQGSVVDYIRQVKSRFCLYQVTAETFCLRQVTAETFCLYQDTSKTSCLYRWCYFIHTSVRGAASARTADTRPSSDCDCVSATAFKRCVSWAMAHAEEDWCRQSQLL